MPKKIIKIALATTSEIKQKAVQEVFQEIFAGKEIQIHGIKTDSKVSDQPLSFEETFQGAKNRLDNLLQQTQSVKDYDYFISIEGGGAHILEPYKYFHITVVLILDKSMMRNKRNPVPGLAFGIAFPNHWFNKMPKPYPDMGTLIKEEYGIDVRDPYQAVTNHLSRKDIIKNAVKNALVQLKTQKF